MSSPETDHFLKTVGERVRAVRESQKLTMEQLAFNARIATSTLDGMCDAFVSIENAVARAIEDADEAEKKRRTIKATAEKNGEKG
jgi:hypothetical protein